jgi:2'-5' RNA ligase
VIRAFIAIELPRELKHALAGIVHNADPLLPNIEVRWVRPESVHLTLKFLGDISSAQVTSVDQLIQQEAGKYASFCLTVGGLGCFPNAGRPRVIWTGIQDPAGRLQELQRGIDTLLETCGFERERRSFKPHLTLGRVRHIQSQYSSREMETAIERTGSNPVGSIPVDRVTLYRSDLKPSGAVYTVLGAYPLGGGG